jgi:hypothetical protein
MWERRSRIAKEEEMFIRQIMNDRLGLGCVIYSENLQTKSPSIYASRSKAAENFFEKTNTKAQKVFFFSGTEEFLIAHQINIILGYTSIPQIFFLDLVNAHRHAGDW